MSPVMPRLDKLNKPENRSFFSVVQRFLTLTLGLTQHGFARPPRDCPLPLQGAHVLLIMVIYWILLCAELLSLLPQEK